MTPSRVLAVVAACFVAGFGAAFAVLEWTGGRPLYDAAWTDAKSAPQRPSRLPPHPENRHRRPTVSWKGFVGSAACRECHAEIADQFARSAMGRSFAPVATAPVIEDYSRAEFAVATLLHARGKLVYAAERRPDGRVLHHERRYDEQGRLLYDQVVPIDYEVGSGQRGRSYLLQRSGRFFQSPVTWYSTKRVWDLSPGYAKVNLRFHRRIVDACLACHVGRARPDPQQPDAFLNPPIVEHAIGCERCHGPGADHVAFQSGERGGGAGDPIVDPGALGPRRRDSVCEQCHLQGRARVLRYGRSDFDFRPGDRLSDVWAVFPAGTGVRDDQLTRAVNQVEQMRSSRCFRESDGALSCTSCHDPHRTIAASEAPAFYRARCLKCHGAEAPHAGCGLPESQRRERVADDSCIACHMPPLKAADVPHTAQTDHRILRDPGRHDPFDVAPPAENDDPFRTPLYADAQTVLPEWEYRRAVALWLGQLAEEHDDPWRADRAAETLSALAAELADDVPLWLTLGQCLWLTGDANDAVACWEHVLSVAPEHEEALRRLARTYHEAEQYVQAAEYFRRYLKVNPWNFDMWGRLAHCLGQMERWDEGIEAAQRALEINPAAARVHGWLAEAYAALGQTALSQRHAELFRKLALRATDRPFPGVGASRDDGPPRPGGGRNASSP